MTFSPQAHDHYSSAAIKNILHSVKTIALVGFSSNESRPSYGVAHFLVTKGYRLFLINPGLAGQEFFGARVYAALADVPDAIDMIDIFRNSDAAEAVVDEALSLSPLPKVIWMQLGVRNDRAAEKAEAKKITIIMNRCPKIEWAPLPSSPGKN